MTYTPGGGYPTLAELRAWLQTAATVLPDDQLDVLAAGEQRAQSRLDWGSTVEVPLDLPDDARAAFYRRVARSTAAKGIPLGIMAADAEYGVVRLARWDSEVERLEGPYVVPVVA